MQERIQVPKYKMQPLKVTVSFNANKKKIKGHSLEQELCRFHSLRGAEEVKEQCMYCRRINFINQAHPFDLMRLWRLLYIIRL